ncbi:MAG: ATP-dependent DNA ligase [Candidatus Anstonellales archaeon]
MKFREAALHFAAIEEKSGRIEMAEEIAELFKKATPEEGRIIGYMLSDSLLPTYQGFDLGIGEKTLVEAIARAGGYPKEAVEKRFREVGDLGLVAEEVVAKRRQHSLSRKEMRLKEVYQKFMEIAKQGGKGSKEGKIRMLEGLIGNASPVEARFIIRAALSNMRLGVGEPTVLDGLSIAVFGSRERKEDIEAQFNTCSDIGYVIEKVLEKKDIVKVKTEVFRPLRYALAERASDEKEIISRLGRCAVEYKYDGFRMQVHCKEGKVVIYSRKMENLTHMFPDVVEAVKGLGAKEIIFEGEALAFDRKSKKFLPFQQTMQRRRKYGVEKASEELPLKVFAFDLLYIDGKEVFLEPYKERRAMMEKIFPKGILEISTMKIVDTPEELKDFFDEAAGHGLEGVIAKDLEAPYTAGKRKFAWIKLKKAYLQAETVDAVVLGYYEGKGKRAEFGLGGLLVGVYNPESDMFETIAKIGTGFSEEEMEEWAKKLKRIRVAKPKNIEYVIEPNHWVEPKYVVEVGFDEITESPLHTCGKKGGKGYALRFPRIIRIREDKGIYEATTTQEIEGMRKGFKE